MSIWLFSATWGSHTGIIVANTFGKGKKNSPQCHIQILRTYYKSENGWRRFYHCEQRGGLHSVYSFDYKNINCEKESLKVNRF